MIYYVKNKLKLKDLIYFSILLILLSYGFDKLYFLRNMGDEHFMSKTYESFGFLDSVNRGLNGIFNYVSSPVSNLLYNIDYGTFSYLEFRPSYLVRRFLPNDVAVYFFGNIDFNETVYLPNNSNTFTTFPPILFAFGLIGSICFFLTFIGVVLRFIHFRFSSNPYKWLLAIIFINHIMLFSIFSTSFLNIVYYFPVVFAYLFPPIKKITAS